MPKGGLSGYLSGPSVQPPMTTALKSKVPTTKGPALRATQPGSAPNRKLTPSSSPNRVVDTGDSALSSAEKGRHGASPTLTVQPNSSSPSRPNATSRLSNVPLTSNTSSSTGSSNTTPAQSPSTRPTSPAVFSPDTSSIPSIDVCPTLSRSKLKTDSLSPAVLPPTGRKEDHAESLSDTSLDLFDETPPEELNMSFVPRDSDTDIASTQTVTTLPSPSDLPTKSHTSTKNQTNIIAENDADKRLALAEGAVPAQKLEAVLQPPFLSQYSSPTYSRNVDLAPTGARNKQTSYNEYRLLSASQRSEVSLPQQVCGVPTEGTNSYNAFY